MQWSTGVMEELKWSDGRTEMECWSTGVMVKPQAYRLLHFNPILQYSNTPLVYAPLLQ
jgi:hypothetical protein